MNESAQIRNYAIKILLSFFLFIVGCTEPFDIKTDDAEPKISIYGVLTDYLNLQEIYISKTSPYFSEEPNTPITNATVRIFSSKNEEIKYMLSPVTPGCYCAVSSWAAERGETYTLNVEVDFNGDGIPELYEATTKIMPVVELDTVEVSPITIMGHKNYSINIYGQDPQEENHYLFLFYQNGSSVNSKITNYIISDDIMFEGEYIDGLSIQFFDSIKEKETDPEDVIAKTVYLEAGDFLAVETCAITKEYFQFISQCMTEKGGENPMFGGPASNIITNISNGAVGFFTGYSTSRVETVVPMHK